MLRTFVRFPVRLFRGTPHEERSSRYGDHAQGNSRHGNRFRVGFKTCRISGSFNELMDLARCADQLPGRQVIRNGKGRTGSAVQFPFLQRGSAFSPLACAGNARGIFQAGRGNYFLPGTRPAGRFLPESRKQGKCRAWNGENRNALHRHASVAMTCPVM